MTTFFDSVYAILNCPITSRHLEHYIHSNSICSLIDFGKCGWIIRINHNIEILFSGIRVDLQYPSCKFLSPFMWFGSNDLLRACGFSHSNSHHPLGATPADQNTLADEIDVSGCVNCVSKRLEKGGYLNWYIWGC